MYASKGKVKGSCGLVEQVKPKIKHKMFALHFQFTT